MLIKRYTDKQIYARPFLYDKIYALTNGNNSDDYYTASAMRDDLDAHREGYFFLAWKGGEVIGWAFLNQENYTGQYQICAYVDQAHRRKGIAKKLCRKAKRIADKLGETIHFQDNRDGMGYDLYAAAGFEYATRG